MQPPRVDSDHTALSVPRFLAILARYFRHHFARSLLVLVACAFETGFYWMVPLSIRFLVDETLPRRDYATLMVLLGVLAAGSIAASAASLLRGHLFARVEAQV